MAGICGNVLQARCNGWHLCKCIRNIRRRS